MSEVRISGTVLPAFDSFRPGDVERILAAIMVSDLREFTAFSNAAPPERVIGRLNAVFGCIVPAVEAAGGEVLKLIGDGLLAIFPLAAGAPRRVCEAASIPVAF